MRSKISPRELLPTPTMLSISLRNLKRSRTRTFLSALGIIIGVFAICSLGMAGVAFIGLFGAFIGVFLSGSCVAVLLYLLSGSLSALLLPSVWIYIPLSMAIGVAVCVLAGLYPAIKAAMMNPIDAMAKAR